MKLEAVAETELGEQESLPLRAVTEAVGGPILARSVHMAVKTGMFRALAGGPLGAAEIARRGGTGPRATRAVLDVLAGTQLLTFADGRSALTEQAHEWLSGAARDDYDNYLKMGLLEWMWHSETEAYLRTGRTLDFHANLTRELWTIYQNAMHASMKCDEELLQISPVPPGAARFLDLGGASGYHSARFCRKYPGLRAEAVDLPAAIEVSRPRFEADAADLRDRGTRVADDVRTMELGEAQYDVIFAEALLHVLTHEDIASLMKRAARALKPGGYLVIAEPLRIGLPSECGQNTAVFCLLLELICQSQIWTLQEIADWERGAGLEPLPPKLIYPTFGMQAAQKPAR